MKFLICHTIKVDDKSERKKDNGEGKRFYRKDIGRNG